MRHSIRLSALALFCSLSFIQSVFALTLTSFNEKPLVLDVDDIVGYEYHHQHRLDTGSGVRFKPDDYHKFYDILDARLRLGDFTLGLRMEGLWYPNPLDLNRELANGDIISRRVSENDILLDQLYLRYSSKMFTVDLGDYYVTFGRGLAVSMRRDGEDIDQSLRGAKVLLRVSDTRIEGFTGLSNTINIDPFHEIPQSDPWDLIGGLRLEQRILNAFVLGGHIVGSRFGALEPDERLRFITEDSTAIAGGSLDVPDIAGFASFYFEGNYMHRTGRELDNSLTDFNSVTDDGAGIYGSLSVFVRDLTLTAEYKYFDDFIFRRGHTKLGYILPSDIAPPEGLDFYEDIYYNNVPTLERTDIETNRTYGNDHGFRLRADYNVQSTQTLPYLALYMTFNKPLGSSATNLGGFGDSSANKGDRIWHLYGGVTQLIGPWEFVLDGGYRDEYNRDQARKLLQMGHAKLSLSVRVAPRHTLTGEAFFIHKDYHLFEQVENDLDLTIGYSFSSYFSISLLYTLQNKNYAPDQGEDELNHFVAAELRSSPTSWLELSVFGGQVRESYRCFGGFCRLVPPFEGLKTRIRIKF
jgi:hypothetical protein